MNHRYRGIDYQVITKELHDQNSYSAINFELKHKTEKGWSFTMRYKMINGFPEIKPEDTSSLPQSERDGILLKHLGL